MPSAYAVHRAKWNNCKLCRLHECRQHVVIARGNIPAPLLFIGEAPGDSEDTLGAPFKGPAGKLMDYIIAQAPVTVPYAMTNLVCCIPRDEEWTKVHDPPVESIEACSERLNETVSIVSPRLIIWVGACAAKHGPTYLAPYIETRDVKHAAIVHPGSIIRMNISQKGFATQQAIINLRDALEELDA